jgi:hypothetical protein
MANDPRVFFWLEGSTVPASVPMDLRARDSSRTRNQVKPAEALPVWQLIKEEQQQSRFNCVVGACDFGAASSTLFVVDQRQFEWFMHFRSRTGSPSLGSMPSCQLFQNVTCH